MNKTLPLNLMDCLDKIYGRMTDNYDFAFPNNNFNENRAHQVLSRFGTFTATIHTLLDDDYMCASNELEKVFFKQMLANAKIIGSDKDWAYPNNQLSETRASSALNCIESSLKNYRNSIKILGNYCFSDKKANFDVLNFVKNVSCLNAYNYAYPDNHYHPDKAHPTIQMLLTITENVTFIVNSVVTNEEEITSIISTYVNKLDCAKNALLKSYDNKNFNKHLGHACLSNFFDIWKNSKEFFVKDLQNYFDKQQLISDYEDKLTKKEEKGMNLPQYQYFEALINNGNDMIVTSPINNPDIDNNKTEVLETKVLPVVKKIKSML